MKLLIVTQAIDTEDPVLGFFHRWVEVLAPMYETVHVICLKEGVHNLPQNVTVHSLGKEGGESRSKYMWRFFSYVWNLRHEYGSVFVHMNQEYVLLAGVLWRALSKHVVLWRNHKQGSVSTRVAGALAHNVCHTSPSAYVAPFKNAVLMPIGIDTGIFTPGHPVENSILFLGRLDEVKRVDVFIDALLRLQEKGVAFSAEIYGDPTDPKSTYAHDVRNQMATLVLDDVLALHPSVPNHETPSIYASHAVYVNLTPSGSFDKTIGEAMSAGCVVVAVNDAVRDVVPADVFVETASAERVADAIATALSMSNVSRDSLRSREREYIVQKHSLSLLTNRLFEILRV